MIYTQGSIRLKCQWQVNFIRRDALNIDISPETQCGYPEIDRRTCVFTDSATVAKIFFLTSHKLHFSYANPPKSLVRIPHIISCHLQEGGHKLVWNPIWCKPQKKDQNALRFGYYINSLTMVSGACSSGESIAEANGWIRSGLTQRCVNAILSDRKRRFTMLCHTTRACWSILNKSFSQMTWLILRECLGP